MRFTPTLFALTLSACTFVTENFYIYEVPPAESPITDTAEEFDTGIEQIPSASACSGSPDEFTASVWEVDGIEYGFTVTEDQLVQMNENWSEGWWGGYYVYDVEQDGEETYADPTCVTDPVNGMAADFGHVQLKLTGQSTGVAWAADTISPLSVDFGEFVDGQIVGADATRWLALHPGTISYIFSEPTTYAILDAIGEPVPRTSLAWVSSNVWGDGIRIPYNTVEKYKLDWCEDHADELGGGCVNLWEGAGDFNSHMFSWLTNDCELSGVDCDETNLREFVYSLSDIPYGDNFEEDTAAYLDWPAIKRSMCGSWMLWIGDDAFHNMNNVVTIEQENGLFRLLYYSVDLSAGASGWYQYTSLNGWNTLANGCYFDADCWQSTMDICEGMIGDFVEADPVGIVDNFWGRLQAAGMVRSGDEVEYERIRAWYEARVEELPTELQCYRDEYAEWLSGSSEIFDTGYWPSDSSTDDSWPRDSVMRGGGVDTGGMGGYNCAMMMDEYLYQ
jgi:hypothetical protein